MHTDPERIFPAGLRKTDLFPEKLHCIGLAAPAGRVAPERYQAACRFLSGLGIKAISGKYASRLDWHLDIYSTGAIDDVISLYTNQPENK